MAPVQSCRIEHSGDGTIPLLEPRIGAVESHHWIRRAEEDVEKAAWWRAQRLQCEATNARSGDDGEGAPLPGEHACDPHGCGRASHEEGTYSHTGCVGEKLGKIRIVLAIVIAGALTDTSTAPSAATMRIAVCGGSGFIGASVCKALVACGCVVTSISRTGGPEPAMKGSALERFQGEEWFSQVNWVRADLTSDEGSAAAALAGADGVVSCIGEGDPLYLSDDGWGVGFLWSDRSQREYDANFEPNKQLVAAAKEAGAKRFVYVGVSSEAELGFGGPNPGLYSGKRAAALAARDTFGDGFTYFGPHLVTDGEEDVRLKVLNSGVGRGLRAVNDFFGAIRSFGPDYTAKTMLTPPVIVCDLALAIAASVTGKVEVEESIRSTGMAVLSAVPEKEQERIADPIRQVDGTQAINALARRAQAAAELVA